MNIVISLFLSMIAGIMNGSYAFPIKRLRKNWDVSLIWLLFSVTTFLLMPWVVNFFINANLIRFIAQVPLCVIFLEVVCGCIFGFGMILFSYSLNFIGIGVSFLLNIATGTILASLISLFVLKPASLSGELGLIEVASLFVFLISIILSIIAVFKRGGEASNILGVVWGVLSGVLTSGQGIAYSFSLPVLSKIANLNGFSELSAANLSWIFIFNSTFVPYFIYFFIKAYRLENFSQLKVGGLNSYGLVIVMAILYFICLLIYSEATILIGQYGAIISWPVFMIFIVLTSSYWGLVQGEWARAGLLPVRLVRMSIVLMVVAIIFLGYDAYLSLNVLAK